MSALGAWAGDLLLTHSGSRSLTYWFIQQLFIEHLLYAAVMGTGDQLWAKHRVVLRDLKS